MTPAELEAIRERSIAHGPTDGDVVGWGIEAHRDRAALLAHIDSIRTNARAGFDAFAKRVTEIASISVHHGDEEGFLLALGSACGEYAEALLADLRPLAPLALTEEVEAVLAEARRKEDEIAGLRGALAALVDALPMCSACLDVATRELVTYETQRFACERHKGGEHWDLLDWADEVAAAAKALGRTT